MAKGRATKRKKRRVSRFTTMCILLGAIVVLSVATLLMRGAYKRAEEAADNPSQTPTTEQSDTLFSLKEITVSGNTRYLPEAIVQVSGLYEGQSVWSVDKTAAAERVLDTFPYIENVEVTNTAYDKLDIAVTETEELGMMYADGQWVVVGANGKVLETQEMTSDRPLRARYFKGATVNSATPGEQAMDERSFAIVTELLDAFAHYELEGVREIDLQNKSDIRLNLNNRVTVKMGNDSNLTHEVGVVVSALPDIEAQYGVNAAGLLDVSAFSEENAAARAVFTPQDLLTPPTTTALSDTEESTTDAATGTTAAQ